MIYLLKFGASFILPPGIFIVMLTLGVILLWKRNRKIAQMMAGTVCLFYLLTTSLVADALLGSLESRYAPPEMVAGDVIIMLGGGATSDTPDIHGQGNLSGSAANRLLTVARLQKKLQVPVILSGGQVYADSGREAVIAQRMLLELGVREDQVLIEDRSLNTKQNAQLVYKILTEKQYTQPILVTSAFHMERSVLNFRKENVSVVPFPADYMVNRENAFYFNKLAPSAGALENSCIFFREWLGILAAKLVQ